jgi:hypothetical protein
MGCRAQDISTWFGFTGVGFMAYRRSRKTAEPLSKYVFADVAIFNQRRPNLGVDPQMAALGPMPASSVRSIKFRDPRRLASLAASVRPP